MYRKSLWTGLIVVFVYLIAVGICSGQTAERFVPAYELMDGRVVSLDIESIARKGDFINFRARIASSPTKYLTSLTVANCKDKKYAFVSHEYVEDTKQATELMTSIRPVESKKGTLMRNLIEVICEGTKAVPQVPVG